ncbi:MAG TPA: DUF11 domain-containing protein [Anaerolineae bacterium]|nr:DUF11 domain-containing protein [Anaerolineae bacterium]
MPVTYTLTTASGTFIHHQWCGWNNACDWIWGYELAPGDTIEAAFPGSAMMMTIADVAVRPDTSGDGVEGTVDQAGFIEATVSPWGDWLYPTFGWAQTTGAVSGAYNLYFDPFDVRHGMSAIYVYFYEAAAGHRTFGVFNPSYWETPYFEVHLPYGVSGTPSYPDELLTVRVYDNGGALVAETSDDHDVDPWRFWYDDFQGHSLQPGYWVEVTGDSGWTADIRIPLLDLTVDPAADLVSGIGPTAQLMIEYETPWGWDSRFVPVDAATGLFTFDAGWQGTDLVPGSTVYAIYQVSDGNRVRQWARIGELFSVEFWLEQDGRTDMWGNAQPGSPITITTPYTTVYAFADPVCGGCWGTHVGDLFPGDAVTVVAAPGNDPVYVVVPDPLTANADSSTDEVWGQIGGWLSRTVEIHGWWDDGYREVTSDPATGEYLATYPDVPRGGAGYVRFADMMGYTGVVFHRPFRTPDLLLDVNYGHDWIETRYEAGHTAWITVTDGFGTPKATMEIQTQQVPWWNPGQTGFNTDMGDWAPVRPDMLAGDWVYVRLDNGQAADVQIGEIAGALDVGADTVQGNVYAGWFTDPLYGQCDVWEDNGVGTGFWVDPDGGDYFCDIGALGWDLLPGHDVGVRYLEPDGDWVINVFREPAPNIDMQKWPDGNAQTYPGGPVVFRLRVYNHGDGPASQVIVTDTLPANAEYVGDSSNVTPTFVDHQVVWDLGPLDPGQQIDFYLYLVNTAGPGEWVHNVADSWALYDEDWGNNHAEAEVYVIDELPDLWVNKGPEPGDPAAGETMLWRIDYGNNGPVPGGPAVLSDTIPVGTSIVRWWSENGYGWEEVASGTQLILEVPSVPGNWGDQVYVQLALDPALQTGTQLTNTVEIVADPDSDPGNNWHQRSDVWVSEKRWDAGAYKSFGWGVLVPGGVIEYNLHVRNHGNAEAHLTLTDLLPAGTSFLESWRWEAQNWVPFPPDTPPGATAVWTLGLMQPGEWVNLAVRLAIDPGTPAGAVLENCARVTMLEDDSWPHNDQSCRVDTVREPGPNLVIEKSYQWNWEGQLQYQVDVRNVGTTELFDVIVGDTLPAYTTFNGNWWHWFWEWVDVTLNTPGYVEWTFSRLEPGWSTGFAFTLDLYPSIIYEKGLTFVNTAEAPIDGDVAPEDNVSIATAYTGPDLYIEKLHTGGQPVPGQLITFTVEFGNANLWPWESDPAYGTHLTDTLPAGTTFVTATAPWNPDERWHPDPIDGNTLVWGWGSQGWQSTWFFDLVVRLDPGLPDGTVLTNHIEVRSDSPDDTEARYDNNVSEAAVMVTAPELAISKSYQTTGYVGDVVIYTLTVENSGSAAATGVLVRDTLPAGLTYLDGGDVSAGGDVTWTIDGIAPGATATVSFRATIDVAGTITNETYLVVDSDQGIGSAPGAPVTFDAVEPFFRFYLPLVYRGY